jgi:hypothetical protein
VLNLDASLEEELAGYCRLVFRDCKQRLYVGTEENEFIRKRQMVEAVLACEHEPIEERSECVASARVRPGCADE